MFDLKKDINKYGGIPPYASEMYGVYQPLLGWESALTKRWIRRGGVPIDPRIKGILDSNIIPAPVAVAPSHPLEMVAAPLQPGTGRSPFTVLLVRDLNSELLKIVRDKVQSFVETNDGRLPEGAEWRAIVDINQMMELPQAASGRLTTHTVHGFIPMLCNVRLTINLTMILLQASAVRSQR